jgi:hypothetical protein
VKTEGRQQGQGGDEARGESNVLQFPRDWLGPRDELVQIGTTAGSAALDGVESDPRLEPEPTSPPGADDFWGEGSAALQDALQAPARAEPACELRHRALPAPRRRWNLAPGRAPTLVGLGVAAVACAAVGFAVALIGTASRPAAGHKRTPALAAGPAHVLGSWLIPPHDLASARTSGRTKRHLAKPRSSRAVHARSRPTHSRPRQVRAPRAASRPSSGSQPVSSSAVAPATASPAPTQNNGSPVSSGLDAGSTTSSGSSSRVDSSSGSGSGSGGSANTSPAGPIGPGAAFGPGQLG